jgi:hypothetical protein
MHTEGVRRDTDRFRALVEAGVSISSELSLDALLQALVEKAAELTGARYAALGVIDRAGTELERFVTTGIDVRTHTAIGDLPRGRGILGTLIREAKPLRLHDLAEDPRSAGFPPNHPAMHSFLGVPIMLRGVPYGNFYLTEKEGGEDFTEEDEETVSLLASQAAVAIENARLYAQIERAFESFVQAAVSAIDLRDPTTAGHSLRVADLVTRLAQDVERKETGPYRDVRFTPAQMRELRFAALLHDVGKVAVSEDRLLKAKKLPAGGWERIDARFDLIARTMQLEACRASMSTADPPRAMDEGVDPDEKLAAQLKELERFREVVRMANEPTVLDAPIAAELAAIARCTYERPDGTIAPYLTPEELHYLRIPKGTLDDAERGEVESHVTASRDLLNNLPWTDDLK